MTECSLGVGSGGGQLFVHGSYEAVKLVQATIFALEPFAKALRDWGDEPDQPDSVSVWDHPIAVNLTLGDFRRAASAMSASGQDAEERLEAKPASAVPEADARPQSGNPRR